MSRKLICFDLDTSLLQSFYPKGDYRRAYKDIRNFLKQDGFLHRQGSVYISKKSLSESDVTDTLNRMFKKYSWLDICTNKLDVSNIDKSYDYLQYRNNNLINSKDRYATVSNAQLELLKEAGVSVVARSNDNHGKIIKYNAADEPKVQKAISSLEVKKNTPKR